MKTIRQMREARADLLIRAKEIVQQAEHRSLTDAEQDEVESLRHEAEGRMVEIKAAEEAEQRVMEGLIAGQTNPQIWIDRRTGKQIRTFRHGEKIADHVHEAAGFGSDLSFGKAVRGIITGHWEGAEAEARAMGTAPGADGGYLVPAPLSAQVIDLARNLAVCTRAGAVVVPMTSKTLSVAAIDEDPSTEWKVENVAASGSDVTLREVLFTAKTLFCGPITASMELIQDAPNAEATVEMAIAGAMAVALDHAALLGAVNGPTGLNAESDVQELPTISEITDYSDFSIAYGMLMETNTNMANASAIYNPSVFADLDALVSLTEGQPLNPPASFVSLKNKLVTNQIPNDLGVGDNETVIFMGDFSQMLIGMRLELTIQASQDAYDAWKKYQVLIRAALRADVQLARPDQLLKMTGITGYTS